MKYKYGTLIAAVAGGFYFYLFYIKPFDKMITLSEMILQLSGSRGSFSLGFSLSDLVLFAMKLLPGLLFELYTGIMLYRHFCTASIYVFSRYPYRVKWYLGKACRLGAAVLGFHAVIIITATVLTAFGYEPVIDGAGIILAVYHLFIHALWVYSMALAVNLTALYFGSSTAYILVAGVQMACIVLLNTTDLVIRYLSNHQAYHKFLIWNPIAHLVLGWHSSKGEMMSSALTSPFLQMGLSSSLIILFLIGGLITVLGAFIVLKHDFFVSDMELGRA